MSVLDLGLTGVRSVLERIERLWNRVTNWIYVRMPKGLYPRALLIIVTPMVILQSVVAFVFMERHYNLVTARLSAAVTQDIAALIDVYEKYPQDRGAATLRKIEKNPTDPAYLRTVRGIGYRLVATP